LGGVIPLLGDLRMLVSAFLLPGLGKGSSLLAIQRMFLSFYNQEQID
jgi:hypothetical protein